MSDTRDHSIYDIIYSRDELIKRIMMLEDENAKLRELVLRLWDAALHPETFGDGTSLRQAMHELGVEAEP